MGERPLWAPWRIEYVTSARDGGCLFCEGPASGDDEAALVVERGARCFSMLNAFPYASGHLMIVPYRHVAELGELDQGEQLDLLRLTRRAIAAMREQMHPAGFNIGLNLGRVAGAGFADHLHLHVVPRWEGDTNFMPVIAGTGVISEALDATRQKLAEALKRVG